MRLRHLALLVLLLPLALHSAGCSLFESDDDLLVSFSFWSDRSNPSREFSARGLDDRLVLEGWISTAMLCPDQEILAAAVREGHTLVVTVSPVLTNLRCFAVMGFYGYIATLGPFETGRYTLQVVHEYPDSRGTQTVFVEVVHID